MDSYSLEKEKTIESVGIVKTTKPEKSDTIEKLPTAKLEQTKEKIVLSEKE